MLGVIIYAEFDTDIFSDLTNMTQINYRLHLHRNHDSSIIG
jgi:hypothetical protein